MLNAVYTARSIRELLKTLETDIISPLRIDDVADVAQSVRASVCGTEGRGFKSHHSPQSKSPGQSQGFYFGSSPCAFGKITDS
jgi:hypothetical protein